MTELQQSEPRRSARLRLKSTTALPEPTARAPNESTSDVTPDLRGFPAAEGRQRLGGISNTTLHAWIKAGKIRVVYLGSRIVIPESEIERILRDGVPASKKTGAAE